MITFFAIPRAFEGHFATIQRNAIESWVHIRPRPQILLLGDDAGTREICQELDLIHIPTVMATSAGAPRVDSVFREAICRADGDVLAYVNADIILLPTFAERVSVVSEAYARFLLIGQRHDVDVSGPLDFDNPAWPDDLVAEVAKGGSLAIPDAIDYLVFSRGLYNKIPPLALGRLHWDNWLVWRAARERATVVDGTPALPAIHQRHDYSHVAGGAAQVLSGVDTQTNARHSVNRGRVKTVLHANVVLESDGTLRAATDRRYLEGHWAHRWRVWMPAIRATQRIRHSPLGRKLNEALRRRWLGVGTEPPQSK